MLITFGCIAIFFAIIVGGRGDPVRLRQNLRRTNQPEIDFAHPRAVAELEAIAWDAYKEGRKAFMEKRKPAFTGS